VKDCIAGLKVVKIMNIELMRTDKVETGGIII